MHNFCQLRHSLKFLSFGVSTYPSWCVLEKKCLVALRDQFTQRNYRHYIFDWAMHPALSKDLKSNF